MKTWTVVVEITDTLEDAQFQYDQRGIESLVSDALRFQSSALKYRVMETIPAPYGPQHPDGVFIAGKDGKPA